MSLVCSININAVSADGVPAASIAVTVNVCDGCGGRGSCDFDTAMPPTSLSHRIVMIACLCYDGYYGQLKFQLLWLSTLSAISKMSVHSN
jgi:hypothetical protein